MALVFDDSTGSGPRTHALVIGVGGYRHLLGGVDERQQTLEHLGLLKQLTSPPRSAVAVAELLIAQAARHTVALGSVDLLVSEAPGDAGVLPAGFRAEAATIGNIQAAFDAWRGRCDTDPDNVALFYYCGHGVEKVEHFLLAEDFGESPSNPWRGAFAFDSTRLAFHSCRARHQIFLVDACRTITSGMLTHNVTAAPLGIQDFTIAECEVNLTIKATAGGEEALGPKKEPSYFAQALQMALGERGAAATHDETTDTWKVSTAKLGAKMQEILRMVNDEEDFTQRCSAQGTGSAVLIEVPSPKVRVVIDCDPEAARAVASLACEPHPVGTAPAATQEGAPFELDVDAGFYTARARFAGGQFADVEQPLFAVPPRMRPVLRCQP